MPTTALPVRAQAPPQTPERKWLKDGFQRYKADAKTGNISVEQAVQVLRSLGKAPTREDVEKFSQQYPRGVSLEQLGVLFDRTSAPDDETILAWFHALDVDKSGYLDRAEFETYLNMGDDRLTPDEITRVLKDADLNRDGRIDYSEFVKMVTSTRKKLLDFATSSGAVVPSDKSSKKAPASPAITSGKTPQAKDSNARTVSKNENRAGPVMTDGKKVDTGAKVEANRLEQQNPRVAGSSKEDSRKTSENPASASSARQDSSKKPRQQYESFSDDGDDVVDIDDDSDPQEVDDFNLKQGRASAVANQSQKGDTGVAQKQGNSNAISSSQSGTVARPSGSTSQQGKPATPKGTIEKRESFADAKASQQKEDQKGGAVSPGKTKHPNGSRLDAEPKEKIKPNANAARRGTTASFDTDSDEEVALFDDDDDDDDFAPASIKQPQAVPP